MTRKKGRASSKRRVAIMVGAGHVPGVNGVIMGAYKAAANLGWELIGIRDGFDGLLYPERFPNGGLLTFDPQFVEILDPNAAGVLGQSRRVDPFQVRTVNEDEMVEEIDMSDELMRKLQAENIDALIGVVGGRGLTIMYKLHRKGLNVVCVPRSIENEIAGTMVSYGFNSALTSTIQLLDTVREAGQASRKIGVVEVLGSQAGWIALQAGIAVGADAVLIPEIPYSMPALVSHMKEKVTSMRPYGLVVVAEGANQVVDDRKPPKRTSKLRASLSPLATGDASDHVIARSGMAAETVANGLQLKLAQETYPAVMGPWVRGGAPTAVDRQLAMAYGVGAVQALQAGTAGSMVAFVPPEIKFVPLLEAINQVRTVPIDGGFVKIARSLGIFLGREL